MDELKCSMCGEKIEEDEEQYTLEDGTIICESCFDDDYFICALCERIVPIDDMKLWGDCFICPDCLEDECPSFDEDENEENTTEAYERTRGRLLGKKTTGIPEGSTELFYEWNYDGRIISYSFTVSVDQNGRITDISRLSAQMLQSESERYSEWRDYAIDPGDYEWIVEDEVLSEYLEDEEESS